jgi:hypothetical protein
LFLAGSLIAQSGTTQKAKPRKRTANITAADVQALKDAISAQQAALAQQQAAMTAQQQQIQDLRDELHRKDQAVSQAQTTASEAQTAVGQQQQSVGKLETDMTDVKSSLLNTATALQETQKAVNTPPTTIHFKGVTITPGGFLAAEFVRRSRALGSDINTPFNSLTMPGASQSSASEFFGSGRQSRISMLAQGDLPMAKLRGYYEADFLSAGVTSNNNQSNSYTLRQRQAFGQIAFNSGLSITGGQMWSLVTETRKGTENRQEALPMTIDPQYTVGFSWARQYGLRVSKNVNDKVSLAVSVENPQATLSTHGNAANFLLGSAGAGGGLYNGAVTTCSAAFAPGSTTSLITTCTPAASYSFNPSPDVIAKAAFDPGFGHYEVFGIYSRFRDRVFPCGDVVIVAPATTGPCPNGTGTGPNALGAYNFSKNGGGVGANARWSFDHKHIDFGLHALAGSGIGRYGTSGLPDTAVRANGTLDLIRSYQGLGTLEWHGPKLDIYLNAGSEYASRAADFDTVTGKYVGYGSPFFNNSGCYSETVPPAANGFAPGSLSSCTADTRALIEGTAGFWYKVYDGSKDTVNRGRVQWGLQYSYVTRQTWSGKGFTPGIGVQPEGLDGMVFASFRYYLPQ